MSEQPELVELTEDEAMGLADAISEVVAEWPQFAATRATDFCQCGAMGCVRERIRDLYGDEAVPAWDRLSNARWLLTGRG
jgi:hypothetical protein